MPAASPDSSRVTAAIEAWFSGIMHSIWPTPRSSCESTKSCPTLCAVRCTSSRQLTAKHSRPAITITRKSTLPSSRGRMGIIANAGNPASSMMAPDCAAL
jgi:hypothetical protein